MPCPTKEFVFQEVLTKYGTAITALLVAYAEILGQKCFGLPKKQLILAIVAKAQTNEAPLLNFNEGITVEFLGIIPRFIEIHRTSMARAEFTEFNGDWDQMNPLLIHFISFVKKMMQR